MLRRTSFVVGFVLSMIEGVAEAEAEPEPSRPQLGEPGSVAIQGDASVSAVRTGYGSSNANAPDVTTTTVSLRPGADVFLLSRFSVGGSLVYERMHASTPDFTATALGGGVRVGYVIPLTTGLHLWPRVGVEAWRVRHEGASEARFASLRLVAQLPLVVEPAPHFFVGFGPRLEQVVTTQNGSSGMASTGVGVATVVGGYFLRTRDWRPPPPRGVDPRARGEG